MTNAITEKKRRRMGKFMSSSDKVAQNSQTSSSKATSSEQAFLNTSQSTS